MHVCCSQPSSHGEFKAVDGLYLLCDKLEELFGKCLFPLCILKGICQGAQCTTHNWCECFLSYLYVYTCFTHKYFIEVGDNLCVYSTCVCLALRRRKTELTRLKAERHHLAWEGYISAMDVKVSKSIQETLIMVSLKWPVSFHKQRDTSELCKTWTLYLTDPVCRALETHATSAD